VLYNHRCEILKTSVAATEVMMHGKDLRHADGMMLAR
jgi:hypothetical protein